MSYRPDWGEDAFRYAAAFFMKHAVRRLRPYYDVDDLLQDSYLLFVTLCDRYQFLNRNHFIHYWRKSLSRMLINMDIAIKKRPTCPLPSHDIASRKSSSVEEIDLSDAPVGVKMLVRGALRGRSWRRRKSSKHKVRQTTNEFLCRIAGIPPTIPLRQIFDAWLAGDNFRHLLPNKD